MTITRLTAKLLLVIAFLATLPLLGACGGGGGTGGAQPVSTSSSTSSSATSNPSSTSDRTPPTIVITGPTSEASYVTTSSTISIVGTVRDNVGLSKVTWTNSARGSGTVSVSGTTANLNFSIALTSGRNVITVIATDAAGNTKQTQLTVDFTPAQANANSGTAVLQWNPVVATNLSGYRVYYGTASGQYKQTVSAGSSTSYTLTGLSTNTRYYFVVTAFDTSGVESGHSNEVYKDIL